jgi:hypothetical protein
MHKKADLTEREVDAPFNSWCSTGHVAPETFKRNGPNTPEEPTRFFQVSGNGVNGIYCELCLIIANWASYQQKKNK